MLSFTAEEMVAGIREFFHPSIRLNLVTEERVRTFYGFLSGLVFLVTISMYFGICIMTRHWLVPEILFGMGGLFPGMFVMPDDNQDYTAYLCLTPISGFIIAFLLKTATSIDPRFVATVLLSLSLMLSSLRISLTLHCFRWIIIITTLGLSILMERMIFVDLCMAMVVLLVVEKIFECWPESENGLHVGWFNSIGILLAWLVTDTLVPWIYVFCGKLQGDLVFWDNYSQHRFYVQLGLLSMCSFIIHQTRPIVEKRDCTYSECLLQLLWNFIEICRPLIESIRWGVMLISFYDQRTKFSLFVKRIFVMFIEGLWVFLEPCLHIFSKYSVMCLSAFIELITEIYKFFKKQYKTLNLVPIFVTIACIYVFYRIYLVPQ